MDLTVRFRLGLNIPDKCSKQASQISKNTDNGGAVAVHSGAPAANFESDAIESRAGVADTLINAAEAVMGSSPNGVAQLSGALAAAEEPVHLCHTWLPS